MNYFDYISQRQAALLHDRLHSTDTGGVDVASSSRYSSDAGGPRYSDDGPDEGLQAHCAAAGASSIFQHHLAALANGGELSAEGIPRDSSLPSYARRAAAFTLDDDARLKYHGSGSNSTSATNHDHHHHHYQSKTTYTATSLHAQHQHLPHSFRFLPPPAGTALENHDVAATTADDNDENDYDNDGDDDGVASLLHGDGRSSESSVRSSTPDSVHAAGCRNGDVEQHHDAMKIDCAKDSTSPAKDDGKTSTNTTAAAAAAAGLTSVEPLIYPWMRRVHCSNNGMHVHVTVLRIMAYTTACYDFIYQTYFGDQ